MRLARLIPAVVVGVAMTVSIAPVSAGGSWFDTDQARYEPGDEVTVVGYTGGGSQGWVEDGPFFAWLTGTSSWTAEESAVDPGFLHYLGPITIHENTEGYPRLRLSITFTLPDDLVDGIYGFDYCNADCSELIGDLIGGTVYVGDGTEGGREPQLTDWEPVRTGEPFPDHVTLIDDAPVAGFVPPVPAGVGWAGPVDAPATTTTLPASTLPETTLPASTLPATTLPAAPTASAAPPVVGSSSSGAGGSRVVLGAAGLAMVVVAAGAVARSRRPDPA